MQSFSRSVLLEKSGVLHDCEQAHAVCHANVVPSGVRPYFLAIQRETESFASKPGGKRGVSALPPRLRARALKAGSQTCRKKCQRRVPITLRFGRNRRPKGRAKSEPRDYPGNRLFVAEVGILESPQATCQHGAGFPCYSNCNRGVENGDWLRHSEVPVPFFRRQPPCSLDYLYAIGDPAFGNSSRVGKGWKPIARHDRMKFFRMRPATSTMTLCPAIQLHAKPGIGQGLGHDAFDLDCFFFLRHTPLRKGPARRGGCRESTLLYHFRLGAPRSTAFGDHSYGVSRLLL